MGEAHLRHAVHQYIEHDHRERNHQGMGNEILDPGYEVGLKTGEVQCLERLGGMLRYYSRDAA